MYTISVMYLDEHNDIHLHVIKGEGVLDYRDLLDKPVMVERIVNRGLVFGREVDGNITRSGYTIPPSSIIKVLWEDDLN